MIKCGLVTFDPILKNKRYTHQRRKRESTTICKQMIFESKAFVFDKSPSGKIRVTPKEKQHFSLKGMSPDLLDNIIMRCGTAYSVCYEAIAKYGGKIEMKYDVRQILNKIDIDKDYSNSDMYETDKRVVAQIRNSQEILNIIDCI